jgi:hypothetical protein
MGTNFYWDGDTKAQTVLANGKEFLDMLEHNCPVEFLYLIGEEFS